ncbi:MAG: hypothetical protein IT446_06600 [Phycisphaerales bacterium]|nr:hypothetical protein [Phycisphaerales bacterium]
MKKVLSGQPLSIPASEYNAFVDAAMEHRRRMAALDQGPLNMALPANRVLVRNDSGGVRGRFDVLGINGVVVSPTDNQESFLRQVIFKGVSPTDFNHQARFVVLAGPLAAGRIGHAYAAPAICTVKVAATADETDLRHADINNGIMTSLKARQDGSSRILWRATGTGEQWAVVQIGARRSEVMVRYGKATADWSSGDTITLTPCVSATSSTATGEPNITAIIISPGGASPRPIIHAGDRMAFLTAIDWTGYSTHLLLPSLQEDKGLPAGTGEGKVLQLDAFNQPFWGYVEAI